MMSSTRITPAGRARGFVDGVLAVVVLTSVVAVSGCASTENRVRVVSRAGALRERAILPTPPERARIAVGPEALDDDELAHAEAAVQRRLQTTLGELASAVSSAAPAAAHAGRADVVRASAAVVLGRDVHRHKAKCRVRVVVDGDVVADAEAEALRTVPVRNRSAWELESVRDAMVARHGRNPLIERDDVVAAIAEACDAALRAVTIDARPEDAIVPDPRDPDAAPATSPALRASASRQRRLRAIGALRDAAASLNARAAALVELVDVGLVDDVAAVTPFLLDPDPRVRRAADVAFVGLCAGHASLEPAAAAKCQRPAAAAKAEAQGSTSAPPQPASSAPAAERPTRPVAGVADDADEEADDEDGATAGAASGRVPTTSEPTTPPTSPQGPSSG